MSYSVEIMSGIYMESCEHSKKKSEDDYLTPEQHDDKDRKKDRELRSRWSVFVMVYITIFTIGIFWTVYMYFTLTMNGIIIPPSIINTIIATSFIKVLGLAIVVLKSLYPEIKFFGNNKTYPSNIDY